MSKKIVFSAKLEHDVIKKIIPLLKNKIKDVDLIFHDPTKNFLDLENISEQFGDADLFIVKVGSNCSLDLLHFAKLYKIPSLHDIDTVLSYKNKVALDNVLRKVFKEYKKELKNKFHLPKSWTQSLTDVKKFKEWAPLYIPFVIKSHYQHDKYMRFNFLVKKIEDIDKFCKMYSNFLYYDVYIQEFIETDGIDRKIYVIGDKVFGIKRENPIYMFLRENSDSIDVDTIERKTFEVHEDIIKLAKILSKELNLKIFGFDLIKLINEDQYHLVDLNDFPGLRGIDNIENELANFLIDYINKVPRSNSK